jgi:hypothetical protein
MRPGPDAGAANMQATSAITSGTPPVLINRSRPGNTDFQLT